MNVRTLKKWKFLIGGILNTELSFSLETLGHLWVYGEGLIMEKIPNLGTENKIFALWHPIYNLKEYKMRSFDTEKDLNV